MKPHPAQPPNQSSGSASTRLVGVLAFICTLPLLILADPPQWWTTSGVTNTNGMNDYAAVNQGQLKNIATAAYTELGNLPGGVGDMTAPSGTFPGGTGYQLTSLVGSWSGTESGVVVEITGSNTNDYAAVNLGQLKNVASLFYNRLIEVGYTDQYPWTSSTNAPNDYAAANIGQVKNLFSFDVTYSSEGSSLPDWWQKHYFGHIGLDPSALAPNLSGQTLLYDYENGIDPLATGTGGEYTSGTASPGGTNAPGADSDSVESDPQLSVGPYCSDPGDSSTEEDTTANLQWGNNPDMESISVQRRDSNGPWETVHTLSSGTTYQDSGLVGNVTYQYRLVVTYTTGQTVAYGGVEYDVPLFKGISAKQSTWSTNKPGWTEFADPSSPPMYYLTYTQTGTRQFSDSYSDTIANSYQFQEAIVPSQHKVTYSGTYSWTSNYPDQYANSISEIYGWSVQSRGKGNLTATTSGTQSILVSATYDPGVAIYSGTSYTENDNYLFQSTFVPSGSGCPIWSGTDFDLTTGSLTYSGSSGLSQSSTFVLAGTGTYSNGSNTDSQTIYANTTPYDTTGYWSGETGTNDSVSGSSSGSVFGEPGWPGEWPLEFLLDETGSWGPPNANWTGTQPPDMGDFFLDGATEYQSSTENDYYEEDGDVSGSGSEVLSQPYTTGSWITDFENDMPDYPESFTDNIFGWDYETGTSGSYTGIFVGFNDCPLYSAGWLLGYRNLVSTEDFMSIQKSLFKFQVNAPSDTVDGTFYEVFLPNSRYASAQYVSSGSYSVSSDDTETGTYEITPTNTPDDFGADSLSGTYYVVPSTQLEALGAIAGAASAGPVVNLDPNEMTSGSAIVAPANASGNGEIDGTFSIPDTGLPGATYTLTLSGNGFTVTGTESGATALSGTTTFSYFDLESGSASEMYVVKTNGAVAGATLTITLGIVTEDGSSLGSSTLVYTNNPSPPNYTIPFDEASGARYRKIGLNGRPLPDEKPQHTAESDEEKEETYIDALTLGLHHSTTDVYVPVAGSDLTITARRDTASEVWNMQSGLRPHERPDRPFGAGWTSNLAANLESVAGSNGVTYLYVTDQNGAVHRFLQVAGGGAVPMPSDQRENGDYLTSLTTTTGSYVFTDRYGTQISFNNIAIPYQIPSDRFKGFSSGTDTCDFYSVHQIKDRFGNALDYAYQSGVSTLIPNTITLDGHSDQVISIQQNAAGQIAKIWDPNGNKYSYGYSTETYVANGGTYTETVLTSGTAPDGAVTEYGYDCAVGAAGSGTVSGSCGLTGPAEADLTPTDVSNGEPVAKYHIDLNSITDPLGNQYVITYQFDHTKFDYNSVDGTFAETGAPRNVTSVILPNNTGTSTFLNESMVELSYSGTTPSLAGGSVRKVVVTDATQASAGTTTYTWTGGEVFNCGGMYPGTPASAVPKVLFYLEMQISYGSGGSLGSETFTFDPTAGLALSSVADLSGNTTSYVYGDTYATPSGWSSVFPYTTGSGGAFFSCYEDPTQQTDAAGHTKTFTYGPWRIMNSVTDEEGRLRTYNVDSLGRRTNEIVYSSGSGSGVVQSSTYTYGSSAFPGVVTDEQVLATDGLGPGNLETSYSLDSDGRVASQTVVNNSGASGANLVTSYTYDADGCKLSATDPRGLKTWFSYDARNRLTSVTYADGTQKLFVYDVRGNKLAEYDENGFATFYQRDALNRVTGQIRDLSGAVSCDPATGVVSGAVSGTDLISEYAYNAVNSKTMSVVILASGSEKTTMAYDGLQRLTATTDADGNETTYSYSGSNCGSGAFDTSGFKPTSITDPLLYTTTVVYDKLYRPTSKTTVYNNSSGSSSTTSTAYDNVGNATSVTDPLGNVTCTGYDALNRVVSGTFADSTTNYFYYTATGLKYESVDENSVVTLVQYDYAGRPVETIADSGGLNATTQSVYDADGNVVSVINPLSNKWDYRYDARNRKIVELDPAVIDATTGNTRRPLKTWEYDNAGNVIAAMDPRLNRTDMIRDAANRVVEVVQPPDATGNRPTTTTQYDAAGNVTQVTDPDSHVTKNSYDPMNRLLATTNILSSGSITVSSTYDGDGNKVAVTDGNGHATYFCYDGLKRNTKITDAGGNTTTFAYDALNKTERTDALGQVTKYCYDVRNRLKHVYYEGRTADDRTYSYDPAGNLLGVTVSGYGGVASTAYSYDNLRRVVTETSNGVEHSYNYDLAGNRTWTQYGNTGRWISSSYDALNRLSYMWEECDGGTTYGYDLDGNIVNKQLPNNDTETETYDNLNRALTQTGSTGAGASLYQYSYTYDYAGNVTQVAETYPGGLTNRTVTNTYDYVDRLVTEADTVNGTTGYTYDAGNNRLTKSLNGTVTGSYSYNAINQLTAVSGTESETFTYDYNGNRATRVLGSGTDTYSYDYENRLVGLAKGISGTGITTGTYAYTYDYRTRRVIRDESEASGTLTNVVFSGGLSVQEYSGTSTTPAVEYIRGSDYGGGVGGVLYTLRSGPASYTHENRRGDVVAKTDGSGSLTYQAAYQAFGTQVQTSGTTADRQKANTKDEDPTGLLNEGFRYRDLDTGVFITKDPAGFVDGPNLYTYVKQNPWTSFDPEGLEDLTVTAGADSACPVTLSISGEYTVKPDPEESAETNLIISGYDQVVSLNDSASSLREDGYSGLGLEDTLNSLCGIYPDDDNSEEALDAKMAAQLDSPHVSPADPNYGVSLLTGEQQANVAGLALGLADPELLAGGFLETGGETSLEAGTTFSLANTAGRAAESGGSQLVQGEFDFVNGLNAQRQGYGPLPAGEQPYQLTLFPDAPYNRQAFYGSSPTSAQQAAAAPLSFDHDPALVMHYWEGNGQGGLPGFNLTQTERLQQAQSLNGNFVPRSMQNYQGWQMKNYSVQKNSEFGF